MVAVETTMTMTVGDDYDDGDGYDYGNDYDDDCWRWRRER